MRITLQLLLIFIFITVSTYGFCSQKDRLSDEVYHSKQWGVSFKKPNEWMEISEDDAVNNFLEKVDFNEEAAMRLLNTHTGNLSLIGFHKYNPKTYYGVIPTIQINVRINDTSDFEQFFEQLSRSFEHISNIFSNFSFVKTIQPIIIDNVKSIYFVGDYDLTTKDGKTYRIRTSTYAIPRGKIFYQVNVTDIATGNNQDLFNSFIDAIRIN